MSIDNRSKFCVVQFIDKPIVGMDDYDCVPRSWVLIHDKRVVVAYPKDKDPFDKRGRAEKEESNGAQWKFYSAILRYESDIEREAQSWMASRQASDIRDAQPEPVLDKKLRSNTRSSTSNFKTDNPQMTEKHLETSRSPNLKKSNKRVQSEPKEELKKKRPKLDEAAKSTRTYYVDYANPTPGCSKTEESIIFRNDPLIQSDQTEKTVAANSGRKTTTKLSTKPQSTKENKSVSKSDSKNPRISTSLKQANKRGEKQSSPVLQDCIQAPSMPLLDVDEHINGRVINSDKEIQPESITEQIPTSSRIPSHASQLPCQPEYVQERKNSVRKSSVELCPDNLLPVPRTQEISVRQAKETNRHGETTHLHGITTAARATAPTTDNQFSQLYQDTNITSNIPSTSHHLPNSLKSSSSLFFDNMTGKSSLSATQNQVDKKMELENITRKIATTVPNSSNSTDKPSSILTRSVTRHAPLVTQNQSQDGPRVQEMHAKNHTERNGNDQKELNSIDHKTIPQDKANNTSAAQMLSNLAQQSNGFVQQSITPQDYLLKILRTQDIPTRKNGVQSNDHSIRFQDTINEASLQQAQNRSNPANQPSEFHTTSHENTYLARLSQALLRLRSTEINNTEHRPPSRNSTVPSTVQITSNVSTRFPRGFEQHIQFPPNDKYSQRDPRLTRKRDDTSMKTNNKSQRPGPQGVTKQTPPLGLPEASNSMEQAPLTTQEHCLLEDPGTQASLSRRYNERNNIDVAAVPRNNTGEPSLFMHNSKVPATCSYHQPHETKRTHVHQNHVYQNPPMQKLLVDQSTEANFTMKRIYFEEDLVRSPATQSSPRVVDSACQTDESFIQDLLSSYQEVVSDYENSTEEAPEEVVNDVDYTGQRIFHESDPADRLTSANHQLRHRLIAEQQMLYEFANLFKQMAPALSYTSDMFKNLKSGILESAQTYKRLLVAVKTFNALGKSETSQKAEERRTGEVDREHSGNGGEDMNNGINSAPTKIVGYVDLC